MNKTQREHWNSDEASHWVVAHDRYDRQLQPFGDAVLAAAAITGEDRVLDIGCGTGSTTLSAADRAASAVGVDVSEPMLYLARQRATDTSTTNVEFVLGDAQTHHFDRPFDVAISRFGVMFFEEPHSAFTNIASALRPGGRLVVVCWQGLDRNDWLLVPGLAAAAHVPLPDTGGPGGPGMASSMSTRRRSRHPCSSLGAAPSKTPSTSSAQRESARRCSTAPSPTPQPRRFVPSPTRSASTMTVTGSDSARPHGSSRPRRLDDRSDRPRVGFIHPNRHDQS
jgi:SAM-dependent methyltransferase